MKKINTLIVALTTLFLTACGSTSPKESAFEVKVIAPKGAPALAFYDMAADSNFVTSEGDHIKEEFGKKDYGMIVMEFCTGLRTVKKSNSNYRLARILTGGNLYLVSRSGKTTEPTENDKVLAFGPGGKQGIPYLSLRALYPQVKEENIVMVEDGAAVSGSLVSGTYKGKDQDDQSTIPVDYVIIPQPALAKALKKLDGKPVTPNIVQCLRDKAKLISNNEQNWVLQAGVFVHKDLYAKHTELFEEKLATIDKNIDTIITNPEVVKDAIDEAIPNKDEQQLKFTCPTDMIPKISKNKKNPNGFGFITAEEWKQVDVQSFLEFLGLKGPENNFTEYLLQR